MNDKNEVRKFARYILTCLMKDDEKSCITIYAMQGRKTEDKFLISHLEDNVKVINDVIKKLKENEKSNIC